AAGAGRTEYDAAHTGAEWAAASCRRKADAAAAAGAANPGAADAAEPAAAANPGAADAAEPAAAAAAPEPGEAADPAAGATHGAIAGQRHAAHRDRSAGRDKQPAAQPGTAAAANKPGSAGAALRDGVSDRQIVDRHRARVNEQTAIGPGAVEHVAVAVDRDAGVAVDRRQVAAQRDRADIRTEIDDKTGARTAIDRGQRRPQRARPRIAAGGDRKHRLPRRRPRQAHRRQTRSHTDNPTPARPGRTRPMPHATLCTRSLSPARRSSPGTARARATSRISRS